MPMTQAGFLANNANACPNCGSMSINDEDYIWADLFLIIDQVCEDCDAQWQVHAEVNSYENLETAEEQL